MANITYHKGTGKENKAEYRLGKATVPAAMVTRMMANLSDKSGASFDRHFYQALVKHEDFLNALEKENITPEEAFKSFVNLKPQKKTGTGQRATKVEAVAEALAKGICKKFKGEPEEMVDSFLELVKKPEFKAEAVDIIKAYKKQFGTNSLGFIKSSGRKGNPAAQKALAKARAAKGKK